LFFSTSRGQRQIAGDGIADRAGAASRDLVGSIVRDNTRRV
jgi:hypothetical protein